MKEQIIQIPDTLEVKEVKDGKIILVEKEKKLTYEYIIKKLFPDTEMHYYSNNSGHICKIRNNDISNTCVNNAKSERQLEKLFAINMLMNVAKYLNDGWQPNWNNEEEGKYYIQIENVSKDLNIDCTGLFNSSVVYFKSEELAQKAIEILGEETIKLALCTNY